MGVIKTQENITHKRAKRFSRFSAGDHKAARGTDKTKNHRLRTVSNTTGGLKPSVYISFCMGDRRMNLPFSDQCNFP